MIGWNFVPMVDMIKNKTPWDATEFAKHADRIASLTPQLLEGFPEGSDKGADTEAKPEIWKIDGRLQEQDERSRPRDRRRWPTSPRPATRRRRASSSRRPPARARAATTNTARKTDAASALAASPPQHDDRPTAAPLRSVRQARASRSRRIGSVAAFAAVQHRRDEIVAAASPVQRTALTCSTISSSSTYRFTSWMRVIQFTVASETRAANGPVSVDRRSRTNR